MKDLEFEIRRANDMIEAMRKQREKAMNDCVMLEAELIALRREIQALKQPQSVPAAAE